MLKAALKLARSGVPVFPCNVEDKSPRTSHGFKDASTDIAVVSAWSWEDAIIGAAIVEGQVVIDVDPRNGGDDTLALFPKIPKTRTTRTRSGGRHYWLLIPNEVTLRGSLGPGIDVKRPDKGYVIVPPSPGYTFVRGGALARMPEWLLDELVLQIRADSDSAASPKFFPWEKGTRYGLVALANALEAIRTAPEGSRNDALNKAAFGLAQLEAGGELARDAALSGLIEAAEHIGLGKWEIRNTIESGWSAGELVPKQAPPAVTA